MPEFVLDRGDRESADEFDALPEFVQGYIEALFFTETSCYSMDEIDSYEAQESIAEGTADGVLPSDSGFADLSEAALASIMADCSKFEREAASLLESAYARNYEPAQAGRDFWFTRNGHGVGFWDRDELKTDSLGRSLSDIAGKFGEVNPYWSESQVEA